MAGVLLKTRAVPCGGLACDRWDWGAWGARTCPVSSVLHLPSGSRQPLLSRVMCGWWEGTPPPGRCPRDSLPLLSTSAQASQSHQSHSLSRMWCRVGEGGARGGCTQGGEGQEGALRGGCAQRMRVNLQVLSCWPVLCLCAVKVPDHASWLEGPDTPGPASEVPQSRPVLSSVPQPLRGPLISPGDF